MYHRRGVHAIVDGQYGSTGKGVFAAYVAHRYGMYFDIAVTNSGPNSGHTFIGPDGEKHILKQLPTIAVANSLFQKRSTPAYISAGAVVDPEILNAEATKYKIPIFLNAQAAIVRPEDREAEKMGSIAAVAGTRMGVGAALVRKIERCPDAVVKGCDIKWADNIRVISAAPNWAGARVALEVSQGFSLGLHSNFYPKVTSRECTVAQGLADARIAPQRLRSVAMTIRTFPIRVGDVDGFSSGDYYYDQSETTWDNLGVEPELTTVTKRVRRVFTFSVLQYQEALLTNMPTDVFVNFVNYIKTKEDRLKFASMIRDVSLDTLGYRPELLFGFGPKTTDVKEFPHGNE